MNLQCSEEGTSLYILRRTYMYLPLLPLLPLLSQDLHPIFMNACHYLIDLATVMLLLLPPLPSLFSSSSPLLPLLPLFPPPPPPPPCLPPPFPYFSHPSLLSQLCEMFSSNKTPQVILEPVVRAGMEALKAAGRNGRLFIFHSSLPTAQAPGTLKNRLDLKLLGTDKEKVQVCFKTCPKY